MTPGAPTPHAAELAAAHGLGDAEASCRVNTSHETGWTINGWPFTVIGVLVGVGAVLLPGVSGWGTFGLLVIALVLLVFGVFSLLVARNFRSIGNLLLHRFTGGFVIEREHGGARAVRYDEITDARLLDDHTPPSGDGGGEHHRLLLRLAHTDGTVWAVEDDVPADMLEEVGRRCGAGPHTWIRSEDAVAMVARHEWTGR